MRTDIVRGNRFMPTKQLRSTGKGALISTLSGNRGVRSDQVCGCRSYVLKKVGLLKAIGNQAVAGIVWRNGHLDPVPDQNLDLEALKAAGKHSPQGYALLGLDFHMSSAQGSGHLPGEFYQIITTQTVSILSVAVSIDPVQALLLLV